MADESSSEKKLGSGKSTGSMGDLVKAESMIQLAIALPAGCIIGWLIGSWLDHIFTRAGWRLPESSLARSAASSRSS